MRGVQVSKHGREEEDKQISNVCVQTSQPCLSHIDLPSRTQKNKQSFALLSKTALPHSHITRRHLSGSDIGHATARSSIHPAVPGRARLLAVSYVHRQVNEAKIIDQKPMSESVTRSSRSTSNHLRADHSFWYCICFSSPYRTDRFALRKSSSLRLELRIRREAEREKVSSFFCRF